MGPGLFSFDYPPHVTYAKPMSVAIGSKWLVDGKVMVVRRVFRGDLLPYEVEPLGNLAPANRFRCKLSALKPVVPATPDPRTPDE